MTFLGIGPGELFLILIIALVVVGPERLPGFARQLGKGIVSLRNWVQRSPDAQMLLRARDELELELRTIRQDLTQEMETVRIEMQSVREEMLQATREATEDVARALDEAELAARVAQEAQETARSVEHSIDELAEQHASGSAELPAALATEYSDSRQLVQTGSLPELQELPAITPDEAVAPRTIAPPDLYPPASDSMISNGQPVARNFKPGQAAVQHTQAELANAQVADTIVVQQLQSELAQLKQQMHDLLALMQSLQAQRSLEGDQENGL